MAETIIQTTSEPAKAALDPESIALIKQIVLDTLAEIETSQHSSTPAVTPVSDEERNANAALYMAANHPEGA